MIGQSNDSPQVRRLITKVVGDIRVGKLHPGGALPGELQFCARFGVGRSTVRESLARLKSMGLVESRRGSGHYVTTNNLARGIADSIALHLDLQRDVSSFKELLSLRELIECACVETLAARALPAHLEQLRRALEAMKKASSKPLEFGRKDLAFHRAIILSSENQLYLAVIDGCFQSLGQRFARQTYGVYAPRIPEILAEHEKILTSVVEQNPLSARTTLQHHLQKSRQRLELLA